MPTIVPAREGLIIRHPDDPTPLPAAGRAVVWDTFWARRLIDGDIMVVAAAAPVLPAARAPVKESGNAG